MSDSDDNGGCLILIILAVCVLRGFAATLIIADLADKNQEEINSLKQEVKELREEIDYMQDR